MTQLHGQETSVRVVDHNTGSPVPFAHFKVTDLKNKSVRYCVTDTAGIAKFNADKPVEIVVTYVGYKNYLDTLYPGKSVEVRLTPDIISFDEVVVTAQYEPVSTDRSLYKVKVINTMQLQKKAAYDLAGLLRTQMNVRLSQDGAIGTGMSMQGLAGENVKILIDGVPVIGRLNGVVDLGQVNVQQAQQVEVIEGPMSVIYGSNALAGVINIIPKDNVNERMFINLNGYYETVGVYNFDGMAGFRLGKHSVTLTAGRNFFDGFSQISSGREMEWKPKRQLNAAVGYDYKFRKAIIKAHLSQFDELLQDKGNLLAPYFERAFDNYFNTQRTTGKLSFQTLGTRNFVMDNSYSTYKRTRTLYYNNLALLEKTYIEDEVTAFRSLLSRGIYTYKLKSDDFGFQTGYDVNSEWAEGQRIGNETRNITDAALFLSMQYKPACYLSLQPGLRAAYNSQYDAPLIYAFHIKAGPYRDFTLRTSYSSGFRAPSLKELYMNFVDVNHNIIGNTNLQAETSDNVQFVLTKKLEGPISMAETELSLFANNVKNIITLAVMPDESYTYINVAMYKTRGINLTYRRFFKSGLDFRFACGTTGNSNSNAKTKTNYQWSPEFSSEISYNFKKPAFTVSGFYKYNGKTPTFAVDEEGTVTSSSQDDYNTLDITLTKSVLKKHLTITAGGKNLFNVTSIATSGAQGGGIHGNSSSSVPIAWGRTAFLRLSYDLRARK
ncbi:MAG: TonB-dependent receptor domain-containing protein [Chloroflexota bacterium]